MMYRHKPLSQNKQADIETHFTFSVYGLEEDLHRPFDACVKLLASVFVRPSKCVAPHTHS